MFVIRAHLEQEFTMHPHTTPTRSTTRKTFPRRSAVFTIFAALFLMMGLSGCAGFLVGAAATAGVAAFDERGIKQVAIDTQTSTNIRASCSIERTIYLRMLASKFMKAAC